MGRKVIVFGATGNTGIEICKELTRLGIQHSAFVRKGSESKVTTGLTEIISGDVLQMKDVEKGIISHDFTDIIIALGSRDLKGGNVRSTGTKNIVDTLKSNSLNIKIHAISAHGVGESWGRLKWYEKLVSKLFIAQTMKDHELQETAIKQNTADYHIIRPVALKDGAATEKVYSSSNGSLPNGSIMRADVAKFLVQSMTEDTSGTSSVCNS